MHGLRHIRILGHGAVTPLFIRFRMTIDLKFRQSRRAFHWEDEPKGFLGMMPSYRTSAKAYRRFRSFRRRFTTRDLHFRWQRRPVADSALLTSAADSAR